MDAEIGALQVSLLRLTLFPTAIVLPSGLQQIFMFSPLVFTTDTHLLAENKNKIYFIKIQT